ncbi:hypothetical protein, partial [Helicobacter rodentium]|uniref:hypothetical protein n=1 Tax=Helicobacter rodentium TaxID=59617 RepID=UPI0026341786
SDCCEIDTQKSIKGGVKVMEENKIVIVSDDSNVIAFDDITIKHDTVDRAEVAEIKEEISNLESQKVSIDEKIVELKAKILYAEKIIAIADAQVAAKAETESVQEDVPVESDGEEIQEETEVESEED